MHYTLFQIFLLSYYREREDMPIVVHHHSVNSVASHPPPPPPHSTPIRKLLMYHIIDTHGLNHVNILKKVNTPKNI